MAASNNCSLFKEAFEGFTPDQKYRAARAALAISLRYQDTRCEGDGEEAL